MFDVFFFSYDEYYAEESWQRIHRICPHAQRIHGIKGTAQAWKAAAEKTLSSHFFSIDADNLINPDFDWTKPYAQAHERKIHVWRCRNVVNGLVYGHGALKLWPKSLVLETNLDRPVDFTCESATQGFVIEPDIVSETAFNKSPFLTWKAAFRECAKLAAGKAVYHGTQADPQTLKRLQVWTSIGADAAFGEYCILGARMGTAHGLLFSSDKNKLLQMNESEYLTALFENCEKDLASARSQANAELERLNFKFSDFNQEQSRALRATLMA